MKKVKRIALVAHDNCKQSLMEWVSCHWETLIHFQLVCTGTTGLMVEKMLQNYIHQYDMQIPLQMTKLKSGPLGGDQQLGALICNDEIDVLIFFWDAMEPQPHDVDIKALLRIATLYNIVYACSSATADFIISSPLLKGEYQAFLTEEIENYQNRNLV